MLITYNPSSVEISPISRGIEPVRRFPKSDLMKQLQMANQLYYNFIFAKWSNGNRKAPKDKMEVASYKDVRGSWDKLDGIDPLR